MEVKLLPPENIGQVARFFDDTRGYGRNLEVSRAHFGRHGDCAPCDLVETGVEKLSVFPESACRDIQEKIDDRLERWTDKGEVLEILDALFTPEMDKRLISYFESEYLPTTVGFRRTAVNLDDESSRWHCDHGPSRHLIIMAYFTPSEPDGNAGTHFVDRPTTERLKEVGYVFCHPDYRVGDAHLVLLADHFKIDFKPHRFDIAAGDAIVFDAPHVMHRGAYPKVAPRYTMAVSLIPSPVDWRTAVERTPFPHRSDVSESYPPVGWSLV